MKMAEYRQTRRLNETVFPRPHGTQFTVFTSEDSEGTITLWSFLPTYEGDQPNCVTFSRDHYQEIVAAIENAATGRGDKSDPD